MAPTVKARDIALTLALSRYLEDLAQKALGRPDGKEFVVDNDFEQKILQGYCVGRAVRPAQGMPRLMKPGGNYCG